VFETAHCWIPAGASQVQIRLKISLVKTNSFTRLVLPSDKKLNLSLCIIKHYVMKAYGGVREYLSLDITWGYVVRFTSRPL